MKKILTFKNIFYFVQAIFAVLIMIGVLPRYYSFFIAAAVLIYVPFLELTDAAAFSVALIPFYLALPFSSNFDTMIYWRLLFIELLILLWINKKEMFIQKFRGIKNIKGHVKKTLFENKIEIGVFLIFLFALASLSGIGSAGVAAGLKRILYYLNIFIFYFVIVWSLDSLEGIKKVLKSLFAGIIVFLSAGFIQLIVFFISDHNKFWKFWSSNVISALYGKSLADFLSFNNSWFAFSKSGAVSLRMFSLFPGSLAFAMVMIMGIAAPLSIYFIEGEAKLKKILLWITLGFLMLGVILSGSRGAWLSIAVAIFAVLAIAAIKKIAKKERNIYIKKILFVFILFGLLFPLSPFFLGTKDIGASSLGRIATIKDMEEVSNKTRLEIWKVSLESIKKHPIFGAGLVNFSAEGDKFGADRKTTSHNIFLYMAAEIGIPASLTMLALCFFLVLDAAKGFFESEDKFLKMFFLSSAVAFSWILGYSLIIDELLNADRVTLIFVTLTGVVYAARRIQKQKRDTASINSGNVVQ